jgi:hypothetical protein
MRNHYLYTEIRQEPASRVQQYFFPNLASTMSWKLCFRLSGTPCEHDINNVSRATPRKLCFLIWVNHPSNTLTAARGQHPLMYSVPMPHSMLEEDSRYPKNALGTRTATYWLPKTWEYLLALL